ncbi:MAG: hypothetical protein ONB07_08090 [candidate division KSB1 bacterium]|nr:hypothetical protein [candidate division KSB1 bacterium]MDZ7391332.1 hypothetical protein [candidate division KSB1 bacterium]
MELLAVRARWPFVFVMSVYCGALGLPGWTQVRYGPDFAVGIKDVGQLHSIAMTNGWLSYPPFRGGVPLRDQSYKGYTELFVYVDLLLGVPEGPWTPRLFDIEKGDTVSLGPAVAEGISAIKPTEADWGPCAGSRGKYFSGDLLLGHLFPTAIDPQLAIMATSTLPQTWPWDLYGFRKWPGSWAREPHTGKALPGTFISDKELFFCFTDEKYADRTFRGARSYAIGAKVECQVHAFGDSYAECATFYEISAINASPHDYWGVFVGVFTYVEAGPYYYEGETVDYLLQETQGGQSIAYHMGYWYKQPEVIARMRERARDPCLQVPHVAAAWLDTPVAAPDGVDNDGDGLVDELEGEKAGLSGFHVCQPYQHRHAGDRVELVDYLERSDRDLWMYKVLSGDTCGLSAELKQAFFLPDAHGVLNPRFDARGARPPFPEYTATNCFLISSGPFDWRKGDTLHFVCALVFGDDLEGLKRNVRTARRMYQLSYQRSGPPPAPQVSAVPGDRKVTLYWSRHPEEAKDPIFGYQDFEGYRIYRAEVDPSEGGWGQEIRDAEGKLLGYRPVMQCDLPDGYYGRDPEYPHFNLGSETGLVHSWTDTGLINGMTYWYSVCAYDRGVRKDSVYNPEGWPPLRSLESPWGTDPEFDCNVVRVVPGLRPSNYANPRTEVLPLPGTLGNGSIGVEVVDDLRVSGHTYTISFEDTSGGHATYWVHDEDTAVWLLQRVRETAGEEGPIFDGLRLWVERFDTVGVWQDSTGWWRGGERSPCSWRISGRRVGAPPRANYEIRFQAEEERGYATGKRAPFSIWNVTTGQKVEWDILRDSGEDSTEEMRSTWTSGDWIWTREEVEGRKRHTWTFVLSRAKEGEDVPPGVGDVARIVTTKPFRVGDRFSLVTAAVGERRAARDDLAGIRVVPNPYVGGAGWEQGGEDRRICFVNVPSRCEVRVYTVGGDHVVTLRHESVERGYCWWDLRNKEGLPVAYGLYLYVVETPEGLTHRGKFAVVR